jgi:phage terminase Nu1 subunit (DNA packaging protein)
MAGPDRNVAAKQLAYLFRITERRVQQLAAEGVIQKEARGRYNLVESVRGYVAFLQDIAAGTSGEKESAYGDARTQKMRADADKSIMEAAELAGNLIPSDIVAYNWNHMTGAFRAKLLNLPKKMAPVVQHENSFAKCNSALQSAIHECLAELSEYRPPAKHFANLESYVAGSTANLDDQSVGRKKTKTLKRKQRRTG